MAALPGNSGTVTTRNGMGKSRLVWELRHSHRTQGWLVLASSSVSYGTATAYLPLIEEVIYRLYLREKLAAAEADIAAGRTLSPEEVREQARAWRQ